MCLPVGCSRPYDQGWYGSRLTVVHGRSWYVSRVISTSAGVNIATLRRQTVSETIYYTQAETNLSVAWARAFLEVSAKSARELSPFCVSIIGFRNGMVAEDEALRHALDTALDASGHNSVETVANTIFPESLWRRSGRNRATLFEQY